MLIRPDNAEPKAGVVLIPKRLIADEPALHSARAIAAQGFAVQVLELAREPKTLDNVSVDEIVEGVRELKQTARELRAGLGGRKVGAVGAWLGGTLALLAGDDALDACVVVCPFVRLPVADDVIVRQPLDAVRNARSPILAVFGELDDEVPVEDVRALERALSESEPDDESYTYPGVGRAFFANEEGNPEYRENAERDLWLRIDRFFEERLK